MAGRWRRIVGAVLVVCGVLGITLELTDAASRSATPSVKAATNAAAPAPKALPVAAPAALIPPLLLIDSRPCARSGRPSVLGRRHRSVAIPVRRYSGSLSGDGRLVLRQPRISRQSLRRYPVRHRPLQRLFRLGRPTPAVRITGWGKSPPDCRATW